MKLLSRMFNTLPKRVATGAILALAIAFPVASVMADAPVQIQAATGIANVTAGDTSYSSSTNATYDQVVKVQVQYINTEAPGSNLVANNVHIKINMPTSAGATQTVTTDTTGSNTNDVISSVTDNTGNANATLAYEAGTTVAKVTNTDGSISTINVPDAQSAVTSLNSAGYLINNGNPCESASVTVLARVMVPGVKIVKQVEEANQSNQWVTTMNANPGDTLKYEIEYQNTGNTVENQVVIRDNLPPTMTLVPNSSYLMDASHPSGVLLNDADGTVIGGGINAGNFGAGANAFVEFEVKVPAASQLACGVTTFTNVGVVRPQGMDEYENSAVVNVNNVCTTPSTPTTPTTPVTPAATPTALVNTGPGSVVAIFGLTTVAGAVAHRLFSRRFARG